MEWLNYHHLLYFWTVAKEGGLAQAAQKLRLSPPTLSSQIHKLEEQLGERLFLKRGRKLALTETGRMVFTYADEIFTRGQELLDAVKGRGQARAPRLLVGIADVVPKLLARRLLQPALRLPEPVHMIIQEDKPERLLAALAVHELDVVISDSPPGPAVSVRAFSHLLGDCGVGLFGTRALVRKYKRGFPRSLEGAPLLVPTEGSTLRRMLERYFQGVGVRPRVVAEVEDSALLAAFGQEGAGLFAASLPIAHEIERQHGVELLGRAEGVRETFYALTVERRIKHPAVAAISEGARSGLISS